MSRDSSQHPDPCIVPSVQPLLTEPQHPIAVRVHSVRDGGREPVEQFIRWVFLRSYGANLNGFYPTLLSFNADDQIRAAVGLRDAVNGELFAEQYLPGPADTLIEAHWRQAVPRERLVEVGNLALASPGEARWLIAAVTTFLHACGYRWVLFTAVRPLFNAFQRLGLNPVQLAHADPARLPGGGNEWGSYYDGRPVVCVGDIQSGYRKLTGAVSENQPRLHALLAEAFQQACPSWNEATRLSGSAR